MTCDFVASRFLALFSLTHLYNGRPQEPPFKCISSLNLLDNRILGVLIRHYNRYRLMKVGIELLARALYGLDTMVLKGAPLLLLYYRDVGARGMNDFDILIPTGQVEPAIDLLKTTEWSTGFTTSRSRLRLTHSMIYQSGEYDFDLHWHVMEECCQPDSDALPSRAVCGAIDQRVELRHVRFMDERRRRRVDNPACDALPLDEAVLTTATIIEVLLDTLPLRTTQGVVDVPGQESFDFIMCKFHFVTIHSITRRAHSLRVPPAHPSACGVRRWYRR